MTILYIPGKGAIASLVYGLDPLTFDLLHLRTDSNYESQVSKLQDIGILSESCHSYLNVDISFFSSSMFSTCIATRHNVFRYSIFSEIGRYLLKMLSISSIYRLVKCIVPLKDVLYFLSSWKYIKELIFASSHAYHIPWFAGFGSYYLLYSALHSTNRVTLFYFSIFFFCHKNINSDRTNCL